MIKNKFLNLSLRKRAVAILIIALIPLIVLEIWATNRLATYGEQISQLDITKRSLILENEVLLNKIAESSSLVKNEQHSVNLGFQKIQTVQYVELPSLALNH